MLNTGWPGVVFASHAHNGDEGASILLQPDRPLAAPLCGLGTSTLLLEHALDKAAIGQYHSYFVKALALGADVVAIGTAL